jgi:hypothetical protein
LRTQIIINDGQLKQRIANGCDVAPEEIKFAQYLSDKEVIETFIEKSSQVFSMGISGKNLIRIFFGYFGGETFVTLVIHHMICDMQSTNIIAKTFANYLCGNTSGDATELQYLDFSEWQANARGVDLNHNYEAGFFEYKRLEEAEGITAGKTRFSGEYPESEPETRALASFIRTLMPEAIVSLHTQGEEIFSKPDTEYVERIAGRLGRSSGYKTSVAEGLSAYGGLCDYTGSVLNIPSFTVELGRGKNPLPYSSLGAIPDKVRNLLIFLPTYL